MNHIHRIVFYNLVVDVFQDQLSVSQKGCTVILFKGNGGTFSLFLVKEVKQLFLIEALQ